MSHAAENYCTRQILSRLLHNHPHRTPHACQSAIKATSWQLKNRARELTGDCCCCCCCCCYSQRRLQLCRCGAHAPREGRPCPPPASSSCCHQAETRRASQEMQGNAARPPHSPQADTRALVLAQLALHDNATPPPPTARRAERWRFPWVPCIAQGFEALQQCPQVQLQRMYARGLQELHRRHMTTKHSMPLDRGVNSNRQPAIQAMTCTKNTMRCCCCCCRRRRRYYTKPHENTRCRWDDAAQRPDRRPGHPPALYPHLLPRHLFETPIFQSRGGTTDVG